MHTIDKGTVNVPAFLTKVWKIVEDPAYDKHICWSSSGKSFIIRNQSQFSKELLPLFFKHNNMASFVRQLNMYGFRKVTSIENSGLRTMDKDEVEFYHQYFLKGHENLLELIKRKVTSGPCVGEDIKKKPEEVSGILAEVKDIKGRQENVDMLLSSMQRENEALWREIAMLRQKYQKQQQIVEKLIQFLLSLVQNRSIVKRKTPLMIDGVNDDQSGQKIKLMSGSSKGPVIHDITDTVADTGETSENLPNFITNVSSPIETNIDNNNSAANAELNIGVGLESSEIPDEIPEILDPLEMLDPLQSVVNETLIDPDLNLQAMSSNSLNDSNVEPKSFCEKNTLDTPSPLNTPPGSPKAASSASRTEGLDLVPSHQQTLNSQRNRFFRDSFSDQFDGIETELGWLQEQLANGTFNIDSNSLLGLFSSDDSSEMSLNNKYGRNFNEIIGNELVEYTPLNSLSPELDLTSFSDKPLTSDDNVNEAGNLTSTIPATASEEFIAQPYSNDKEKSESEVKRRRLN